MANWLFWISKLIEAISTINVGNMREREGLLYFIHPRLAKIDNHDVQETRSGPKRPAAAIGGGDFLGSKAELHSFWFIVRRKLVDRRALILWSNFFEAVLASKWPQRPNMTSPMAFSWQITPSYQFPCVDLIVFVFFLNFQRRRRLRRREPTYPRPASWKRQVKSSFEVNGVTEISEENRRGPHCTYLLSSPPLPLLFHRD